MDNNQANVSENPNDNNNVSSCGNTQDPHQRHSMFTTSNAGDLIPFEIEQIRSPSELLPNPDSTSENTQVFSQRSVNVAEAGGVFSPEEISYIYPCRYCMEPQASTSTHDFDEDAFSRENMEQDTAMDISSYEPFPNTSAERSTAVTNLQVKMQAEGTARYRCKRHRDQHEKHLSPNPEKKSKFE